MVIATGINARTSEMDARSGIQVNQCRVTLQ